MSDAFMIGRPRTFPNLQSHIRDRSTQHRLSRWLRLSNFLQLGPYLQHRILPVKHVNPC